ncbi:hypothetical protein EVA_19904, partial [gut metagenome]
MNQEIKNSILTKIKEYSSISYFGISARRRLCRSKQGTESNS